MPHRTMTRALVTLVAAVSTVVAVALTPTAAQAAPTDHYVSLGDSYSSGVGAGSYDMTTCLRSDNSYGPLWAAANGVASFKFPACGGAEVPDVLNEQVSALSADTTMVTITIGGNDAGFSDVMSSCRFGSDDTCTGAVNEAKAFVNNGLSARLDQVYAAIRSRSPNARLIVLGYPRLFEMGWCGVLGINTYKRTIMNETADLLVSVIAARAGAAGATFVDVRPVFAGHGICSDQPWIHDLTGLIGAFHPTLDGYRYGYLVALNSVTS